MIRRLLVLFVLIRFTDLSGHDIWVERNSVVSVSEGYGCDGRVGTSGAGHAKINTGSGQYLCLQETVAEAVERLEKSK